MKKNLIALAVAAAMAPGFAAAEGVSVSGFADITHTTSSDADLSVFLANGEIDLRNTMGAVSVGLDVDVAIAGNGGASLGWIVDGAGPADGAVIEQAFFAWKATDAVTVIGGVFNNPIGWDAEDAPDMDMVSHTLSYEALDNQTALYGNNLAGVAAAFAAGPATITAAVVNDIGLKDSDANLSLEDHSFAVVANFAAMEGLDIEVGYVTQADDTGVTIDDNGTPGDPTDDFVSNLGVGNVADVNATFKQGPLTVKADFMMPSEAVDNIIGLYGRYDINDQVGVAARYEVQSYDASGVDDDTVTTLYANYKLADNLNVAAEWYSFDDGSDTTDAITLKFLAKF
ncbi:MAG: hypothetical protein AB1810_00100 [Pseudomonadota bacterium]